MVKPILITTGEPAGIGVDITLMAAMRKLPHPVVAIGNKTLLAARASQLDIPVQLSDYSNQHDAHIPGNLSVIDLALNAQVEAGQLNVKNANYVMHMLQYAGKAVLKQQFSALITCPVQKSILSESGQHFSGHTEFFADLCGVKSIVMMLANPQLKVALMTTHLPINQVASNLSKAMIIEKVCIINHDLKTQFGITSPRILLCGLNPHAGENGHLGCEEIEIINPAAEALRTQFGIDISDALPADTVFTASYREKADVIVSMFHDQGLPVIKALGFGHCTNITLGLPIIRTSVDHGTALSLAGSGKASDESLFETILLTKQLIDNHAKAI
ncbi:MAG: 4-hydroxythreonine-4-phosphate dehydrogenase PdxA [Legionellales bacterium]|nr:4-hydroxythreonine-4-phosphate dehydrogenase PdxA [Legionellales bacterium]